MQQGQTNTSTCQLSEYNLHDWELCPGLWLPAYDLAGLQYSCRLQVNNFIQDSFLSWETMFYHIHRSLELRAVAIEIIHLGDVLGSCCFWTLGNPKKGAIPSLRKRLIAKQLLLLPHFPALNLLAAWQPIAFASWVQ